MKSYAYYNSKGHHYFGAPVFMFAIWCYWFFRRMFTKIDKFEGHKGYQLKYFDMIIEPPIKLKGSIILPKEDD